MITIRLQITEEDSEVKAKAFVDYRDCTDQETAYKVKFLKNIWDFILKECPQNENQKLRNKPPKE